MASKQRLSLFECHTAQAEAGGRSFEHAERRDPPPLPAAEGCRGQSLKELKGPGNVELDVKGVRHLAELEEEHVLVVLVESKQLVALGQHHGSEQVDGHGGVAGQEEVEKAGDLAVILYVVGEHGDGIGKRKRRLVAGQVGVQARVGSAQQGPQQLELGHGGGNGGEHEVADAQETQAGDGGGGIVGAEDKEEDLDDVVVALEVAQRGVSAQYGEDDTGEVLLALGQLRLRVGGGVVDKGAMHVQGHLVLVFVAGQLRAVRGQCLLLRRQLRPGAAQ